MAQIAHEVAKLRGSSLKLGDFLIKASEPKEPVPESVAINVANSKMFWKGGVEARRAKVKPLPSKVKRGKK